MLSLETIETALMVISILFVLCGLWVCVATWWMLASGEVEEYRRMVRAEMVRRWCCDEEESS
jgi:hypothetical protein